MNYPVHTKAKCEAELFGFLKSKFRTAKLGTQQQIEIVTRILENQP